MFVILFDYERKKTIICNQLIFVTIIFGRATDYNFYNEIFRTMVFEYLSGTLGYSSLSQMFKYSSSHT